MTPAVTKTPAVVKAVAVTKTPAVVKAAKSWERAKRKLATFMATYNGTDEAFDTRFRLECAVERSELRLQKAWMDADLDQARARDAAEANH